MNAPSAEAQPQSPYASPHGTEEPSPRFQTIEEVFEHTPSEKDWVDIATIQYNKWKEEGPIGLHEHEIQFFQYLDEWIDVYCRRQYADGVIHALIEDTCATLREWLMHPVWMTQRTLRDLRPIIVGGVREHSHLNFERIFQQFIEDSNVDIPDRRPIPEWLEMPSYPHHEVAFSTSDVAPFSGEQHICRIPDGVRYGATIKLHFWPSNTRVSFEGEVAGCRIQEEGQADILYRQTGGGVNILHFERVVHADVE